MATDIIKTKSGESIHSGSVIVTCSRTGEFSSFTTNVHILTIESIENKYDNRFNVIFPVQLYGNQIIVGG